MLYTRSVSLRVMSFIWLRSMWATASATAAALLPREDLSWLTLTSAPSGRQQTLVRNSLMLFNVKCSGLRQPIQRDANSTVVEQTILASCCLRTATPPLDT